MSAVTRLLVVVAPSRATPQMGLTKSAADYQHAIGLAGPAGIIVMTEIMRVPWRRRLRRIAAEHHFAVIMPTRPCMSPILVGPEVTLIDSGSDPGCGAVLGVSARRDIAWALAEVAGPGGTFRIGIVGAHWPPGAYNAGTLIQRIRRRASVVQWGRMQAAVQARQAKLRAAGAEVLIQAGDDNRGRGAGDRGGYQHPGDQWHLRNGVVYLGVAAPLTTAAPGATSIHPQNADHAARLAIVRLTRP